MMRMLAVMVLVSGTLFASQDLCFSGPRTCTNTPVVMFAPIWSTEVPRLPAPPAILPAYRPVAPLQPSPITQQFYLYAVPHADLLQYQTNYATGVETAPVPNAGSSGVSHPGVMVNLGFGPR